MTSPFIIVIISISLIQVLNSEPVIITNGYGILTGFKTSPTTYGIKEIEYNVGNVDSLAYWEIKKDPLFVNGVFIHSVALPDRVWDSKARQSNIGNPVILYFRKNSTIASETSNQRWNLTDTKGFRLMMDPTKFALVNTTGASLANAAVVTQWRMTKILRESSLVTVTFNNPTNYNVTVFSYSPVRPYHQLESIRVGTSITYRIFPDTTFYFYRDVGFTILPSTYISKANVSHTINLGSVVPFPVGMRQWESRDMPYKPYRLLNFTIEANGTMHGIDATKEYPNAWYRYPVITGHVQHNGSFVYQWEVYYGQVKTCKGKFNGMMEKMDEMCGFYESSDTFFLI